MKLEGIGFHYRGEEGRRFVRRIKGKDPLYVLVLGNTETGKIPGVSAAGAVPEITDFTPAADAELLFYGRCKCINGVPVTPDGIPTPALITMSALQLIRAPTFVVEGGLRVKPKVPYFSLGGEPGGDIRKGEAVKNAAEVMEEGVILGRNLAALAEYLVVGESIAGGTTTALGVLTAMGVNGMVSSSMPSNPLKLKKDIVADGMKRVGASFGSFKDDPISAVEALGDPMMPAFAGVVMGAAEKVPVLMAGGTQMTAILAIVAASGGRLDNIAIGTTRWIVEDESSDIAGTVEQVARVPVIYTKLSFAGSKYLGLRVYEEGMVKEGVGAGGMAISASLKGIELQKLLWKIEENYSQLVGGG
jgi:uncharacterized protein (TIGR00303 family)